LSTRHGVEPVNTTDKNDSPCWHYSHAVSDIISLKSTVLYRVRAVYATIADVACPKTHDLSAYSVLLLFWHSWQHFPLRLPTIHTVYFKRHCRVKRIFYEIIAAVVCFIMPNTHRRRDSTVVGGIVGGMNAPVSSRDPVYNFLCCRWQVTT